jgi:hypothetical protein
MQRAGRGGGPRRQPENLSKQLTLGSFVCCCVDLGFVRDLAPRGFVRILPTPLLRPARGSMPDWEFYPISVSVATAI